MILDRPHIPINAEIMFRSLHPVNIKPAVYTVGSFTLVSLEGKEYIFDWMFSGTNFNIDEQGHLVIDTKLGDFDDDYFYDSNEYIPCLTPKFITDSTLKEIFYECFMTDAEDESIELELLKFRLFTDDRSSEFTEEQIQEFNKLAGD